MTVRNTRIVRSGEVRGWSSSMAALLAKGFSAGAITPSGSRLSSIWGRGEPASSSEWRRCNRSRIFSGCRRRQRFIESGRLEIQEQRNGDRLQIANPFRSFHRHAGQDARAPGLLAQLLRELRRELFQLVDVLRLGDQRESQISHLCEIAIVNLQAFDRFESTRQKIQHFGVELHPRDQDVDRGCDNQRDRAPDRAAPLRDEMGDEGMKAHDKT